MYKDFRASAIKFDKRNKFSEYSGDLCNFPNVTHGFYKFFDPIDVEVDYDGLAIRFCPAGKIAELQDEYAHIHAQFVFATCNGDPVFLNDKAVYTCSHDNDAKNNWEQLADSFDDYIAKFLIN